MGNFLSGGQARLIPDSSAQRAASLFNDDLRHVNGQIAPFSKEGGDAC